MRKIFGTGRKVGVYHNQLQESMTQQVQVATPLEPRLETKNQEHIPQGVQVNTSLEERIRRTIEKITSDGVVEDEEFEKLYHVTLEALKKADNNYMGLDLKPIGGSGYASVTLKYENNEINCWQFWSTVNGSYDEFLSVLDIYKKFFDVPEDASVTVEYREDGTLKSKTYTIDKVPTKFENFDHAHVDPATLCYYMPDSSRDYAHINCDWAILSYKEFIKFYNKLLKGLVNFKTKNL